MINVEVEKKSNENTLSLMRRFTRRIRGSGVLNRVRDNRYYKRPTSKFTKKKSALKRIEKRAKRDELIRLGKISEDVRVFGREAKRRS